MTVASIVIELTRNCLFRSEH